eukprot:Colp12_sorted_trinity150504_noHs@24253
MATAAVPTGPLCFVCKDPFQKNDPVNSASGNKYHTACYVCTSCMQPFPDDEYYEYEGKLFCPNDYKLLWGPKCAHCHEHIEGTCVTALERKWHPEHFNCTACGMSLASNPWIRHGDRAFCKPCSTSKAATAAIQICARCSKPLDGNSISVKGQPMHPEHFQCTTCRMTLNSQGKEYEGKLYCAKHFEQVKYTICAACRRPIDGLVITALGKTFHPEHFVCVVDEKPLEGDQFFEVKGKMYCKFHHQQLYAERCFRCNTAVSSESFRALGKLFCGHCFLCFGCDTPLVVGKKVQFIEVDLRPFCGKCHDRLPKDLRRRFKEMDKVASKLKKDKD